MLLVSKPPGGEGPLPEGSCTTSAMIPALDLVEGVAGLGYAIHTLNESDGGWLDLSPIVAGGLGVYGLAFSYSAYQGFSWTSECRRRVAMSEEEATSEEAITAYLRTISVNGPKR